MRETAIDFRREFQFVSALRDRRQTDLRLIPLRCGIHRDTAGRSLSLSHGDVNVALMLSFPRISSGFAEHN